MAALSCAHGRSPCVHAVLPAAVLLLLSLLATHGVVEAQPQGTGGEYRRIEAQLRGQLAGREGEATADAANLRMHLATVLQSLNYLHPDGGSRLREAEELYRSVIALIPGESAMAAGIYGNLAVVLLDAFRPEDAIVEVDHAIRLSDDIADVSGHRFNRAKMLSMLGRLDEAEADFSKAASTAHGHSITTFAKSVAGMERMDDELLALVEDTLAAAEAAAAAAKITVQEGTSDGGASPAWLSAASERDLSWLGFAAFKALDKRKNYACAFNALTRANALMRSALPDKYSHDVERRNLNIITSVFKAPTSVPFGYPDESPVFVVGLPRSGSTLLESIIATHSQAWGAGEDTMLAPLTAEFNALIGRPNFNLELWQLGKKYVDSMYSLVPSSVAARPARIVDKMLRNLWMVGHIDMMLPRAKVIHVVRHPFDAGFSCFAQPFAGNSLPWAWDLVELAHQINITHEIAEHWDAALPGRVKTIHYEELVAYPREVAREVLEFVGLPWEEGVLDFHKTERSIGTASVAQVRQPLYQSSVAKWRRYEGQLQPLAAALGGRVKAYEESLSAALARRARAAAEERSDASGGPAPTQHDATEL